MVSSMVKDQEGVAVVKVIEAPKAKRMLKKRI